MEAGPTPEACEAPLSVDQFEHYIQEWSKQNKDRDAVHHKLLRSLKNANDEIDHLRMNLESESTSRRQYQIQNHHLEAQNKCYENKAARNPYVIVLVDGDGAIFRDNLIGDGKTGGSNAAYRLKKQVDEHLRETPLEHDIEILARVYANIGGLGKTLCRSGLVSDTEEVPIFAGSFTKTMPGFDFIDVDYGKENADFKIRHLLRWHYMDERCKKIFLVACHDAGYVNELRPLLDENSDRIVLVETTPALPAFRSLGLRLTHFDSVFRDAPLEHKIPRNAPSSPVQSASNHILTPAPSKASAAVEPQLEHRAKAEPRPDSYATVCGDNGKHNIVIGKDKKQDPAVIKLNEDGNRIDPPIQDVASYEVRASFTKKLAQAKKGAFCNRHYLEDGCPWGGSCNMEHAMELTVEEVALLRFKARTGPCSNGPRCIDMHCSRGHHCPLDPSCQRRDCQFRHPKFGDMHLGKKKMKAVKRMVEGEAFPERI